MTKSLPTIYKHATTGKEQQWQIFIDGDTFYTVAGQVGGKLTTSKPTKCKGKNVGKANGTTPESQALAEATAKRNLKLESGYAETLEDLETLEIFYKPMLAHEYTKRRDGNHIKFPVIVQRKFDGIRCILKKDGAWTRKGKRHQAIPHIEESFKDFFEKYPDTILDGELYNHNLKHNFNKISSLVRKQKPTVDDLAESKQMVKFYIYDAPRIHGVTELAPFLSRYKLMARLVENPYVVIVDNIIAKDNAEVETLHDQFVQEGYEGAIVRKGDAPYKNSRSNDLLKFKSFNDEEFIVVDVREGDGNKVGLAAHVDCLTKDGQKFTANTSGSESYRRWILEERENIIGKEVTIRFFRYTPDGIPRFPYFHTLRDYE